MDRLSGQKNFHYGLDFVLSHRAEDVAEAIDMLASRNRFEKVKRVVIRPEEKPALRRQLEERMKVRRRKAERRRGEYRK